MNALNRDASHVIYSNVKELEALASNQLSYLLSVDEYTLDVCCE